MKALPFILLAFIARLLLVSETSAATRYVEGDVIVTFKPSATLDKAKDVLRKKSLTFSDHFGVLSSRWKRQTGLVRARGRSTADLIAALKDDPDVESAEPNYLRWINAAPNDTRFAEMWALQNSGQRVNNSLGTAAADVKFIPARDLGRAPRSEVVVGVIDTGLDYVHSDIAANVWVNTREIPANRIDDDGNGYTDDYNGYDFADGDADPLDVSDHGTHVAGTIAAVGDNQAGIIGVCDDVRILPLKVSSDGDFFTSAATISAMQYATVLRNRGVNIVALNASYGGGGFSSAERAAIQSAGNAGILICVSAGNEAADNNATATYPASYRLPNMIVVAATGQNDTLASYSNFGATTVDLAAPGSNILSTVPSTVSLRVGTISYNSSALEFSGATPGLSGNVVNCGTGNSASDFPPVVRGHIALMQRGTQDFSVKVSNAMKAGAKAAIIWNNATGPFQGSLQTGGNWIPARSISQADGLAIRSALPRVGSFVVTPEYRFLDGTSMAAPHVSGAVAFAAINFPDDTAVARRQRILAGVDVGTSLQGKVVTGGRLNLLRIVDANGDGLADWRPVITSAALPLAIHGETYVQNLAATGGSGPYAWSTAGGALPAGFSVSSTGVIAGTSSITGAFNFTAQVTDSTGASSTRQLTVNAAASGPLDHFTWDYLPAAVYAGKPFAIKVTARDSGGRLVSEGNNAVALAPSPAGGSSPALSPASVSLKAGAYIGYVTVGAPAPAVTITATQGGTRGTSPSFVVNSGDSVSGDGLPDSWKVANGLGTSDAVAALDADGDGKTNLDEYKAGTNPRSSTSALRVTGTSTDGRTQFTLSFAAEAGKLYRISTSDDLATWVPSAPAIFAATSGIQTVTVDLSGESSAFFRVDIAP